MSSASHQSRLFFVKGTSLKGKNSLPLERILTFKSSPLLAGKPESGVVKTRTYDLNITYDKILPNTKAMAIWL